MWQCSWCNWLQFQHKQCSFLHMVGIYWCHYCINQQDKHSMFDIILKLNWKMCYFDRDKNRFLTSLKCYMNYICLLLKMYMLDSLKSKQSLHFYHCWRILMGVRISERMYCLWLRGKTHLHSHTNHCSLRSNFLCRLYMMLNSSMYYSLICNQSIM